MIDEYWKKNFSINLKRLMKKNNKTQNDMINDLGLSSATISSWVNGSRFPRMDKINLLADYFNVDEFILLAKPYDVFHAEVVERAEKEEKTLLEDYRKLNSDGQAEARKQVNNLTKIKDYTENEKPYDND